MSRSTEARASAVLPPPTADGWRVPRGEGDEDDLLSLVVAIAAVLRDGSSEPRVLVARDGRADGAALAARFAGVLVASGCDAANAGALPTPVVTHAVAEGGFDAAVIVTASHNPAGWTGLKLKVSPGCPPDRDLEQRVQSKAEEDPGPVAAGTSEEDPVLGSGLVEDYRNGLLVYLEGEGGETVVVDGLNGVGGGLLGDVLAGAGCRVTTLGAVPKEDFGGVPPDPTLPEARDRARTAVLFAGADVGFVLDGDADRLGVLDERGRHVPPEDILALLLPRVDRGGAAAVAATVGVGSIVRRAAIALGVDLVETPIGFKHIAPLMVEGRVFAGGGGVGDIGFRFHGFDRDPFVTALMVVAAIREDGRPLGRQVADLHRRLGATVVATRSVPLATEFQASLEQLGRGALDAVGLGGEVVEISRLDGVKFRLAGERFLLLRIGTTEPVLRLNLEMGSAEEVDAVLESIRIRMEAVRS